MAELQPWEDYTVSDEVWSITTVMVDANRGNAELEGAASTWVPGNEGATELGQIALPNLSL